MRDSLEKRFPNLYGWLVWGGGIQTIRRAVLIAPMVIAIFASALTLNWLALAGWVVALFVFLILR